MKRWSLITSFVLFIVLCASAAYWALQLFQPPLRPVAAPPRAATAEVRPEAAGTLFGGRAGGTAIASNYNLRGVIFSGNPRDSVAILSADGKPAQAIRVGAEVVPGVTVREVHRGYVLLAEGEAVTRVELPEDAGPTNLATSSPVASRPVTPPPSSAPQGSQQNAQQNAEQDAQQEGAQQEGAQLGPASASGSPNPGPDAAAARRQHAIPPSEAAAAQFAPGTSQSVIVNPADQGTDGGAGQSAAGSGN